jgi:choline-sulfatase
MGPRPLLPLLLLGLVACAPGPPEPEALLAADTSLLLVTLDTTRADRLGCYGHADARTPNLDRLATRGARFERAYAHVPLTLPTHASLLTGTLPPEHGLHDNGRAALGPELTTMAELFAARGHRTGAFVSAAALDRSFGLDRGFEVYDDRLEADGARALDRPADAVVDAAVAWLAEAPEAPFFLWVHFYDPHAEYAPPPDFALPDPYDGELAHVDAEVGRLLSWLESRRLDARTLVVVVADHGESLGEKGEPTHASLIYDGTQRIPLLVALPGVLPGGVVVDDLVQQADLLPTVLELYGWAPPEGVSGASFAPLLRGGVREERPVWIESEYAALNFGWSPLRGLVSGRWKLIDGPRPELYDLEDDPGETRDLAAQRPEVVERLRGELAALAAELRPRATAGAGGDPDLARRLSGLGYAQGGDAAPGEGAAVNPVDHVDVLADYHAAIGFQNRGEYARMVAPLERAVARFPDSVGFRTQLGDAHRRLGRAAEARAELEAALALDPTYEAALFYLAELDRAEGDGAAARAGFLRVLELRPAYLPAREALAALDLAAGDAAAALAGHERLVADDGDDPRRWLALADVAAAAGAPRRRAEALARAAALAPEDPLLGRLHAWSLATTPVDELRDGARALALARADVERTRRAEPTALLVLAAALAETGAAEEALSALEEAAALARAGGDAALLEELERHREALATGRPLREG